MMPERPRGGWSGWSHSEAVGPPWLAAILWSRAAPAQIDKERPRQRQERQRGPCAAAVRPMLAACCGLALSNEEESDASGAGSP
jgi:hypothetical protein